MKKKTCLLGMLAVFLLLASACQASDPQELSGTETPEETPAYTDHIGQGPAGDVDGDGVKETLSLKLTANQTRAALCVNGEEVLDLAVKGEFDFSYAEIVAADMDGDGRDEVLILSSIPARYGGFTFQYAEFEEGAWRELAAQWPQMELTFSEGWSCTLTVDGARQTETVENSGMRDAYFDENGFPYGEEAFIGCYTDAAQYRIDGSRIHFTGYAEIRGAGADGLEPSFQLAFSCAVSVEEDGLTVDGSQLCQAILSELASGSAEQ